MKEKKEKIRIKKDKHITKNEVGHFVEKNMIDYGKYVIEDRAVADYRDGIKPVQRRIIWTMHKMGVHSSSNYKKCATIVGACMHYHPHGDSAIFQALVNMVNSRYPLIDGQGNFGSLYEESAAPRYIEARLSKLADYYLSCLEVCQFTKNFTGESDEPVVIPSRLPLLLMNGIEGIAVGLRNKMPSHNLGELAGALKYILKSKKPNIDKVMDYIKGPDFVYGGWLLSSKDEVKELYETGRGRLKFSCSYKYEQGEKGHTLIIVDSFCPNFNPTDFLNDMEKLIKDKLIVDAQDNSSKKNGNKIVIEVTNQHIFKNKIKAKLEKTVSYEFYVTERSYVPERSETSVELNYMNLIEILQNWLNYRRQIETKMLKSEMSKTKKKLFYEKIKLLGINNIKILARSAEQDKIESDVYLVKYIPQLKALYKKDPDKAMKCADMLLDMTIKSLKRSGKKNQKGTILKLKKIILRIKHDLSNIDKVVLKQLKEMEKFADDRRTKVAGDFKRPSESRAGTGGEENLCGVSLEGKTIKGLTTKGLSTVYRHFASTFLGITVSCKSGWTGQWELGDIGGNIGKAFSNPIGAVSFEFPYILYQSDDSKFTLLSNPQTAREFQCIKTDKNIVGMWGLYPNAKIICWGNKKTHKTSLEEILDKKGVKRRNSKGFYITPFYTVEKVLVINEGCSVADKKGELLNLGKTLKRNGDDLYEVGDKNFIMYSSGTKKILNKKDTIKALRRGIDVCLPLMFNAKGGGR